jgi:2-oxoisovalerate dehydrogenase E2 component (dihydrolipoyl transacylase)
MSLYVFKLPDVGEGTAEAEIVAWHVGVGETVEEDAPLVDVMTDKATVEITSPVRGKVLSVAGSPGEMATVGAPLVELETDSEDVEVADAPAARAAVQDAGQPAVKAPPPAPANEAALAAPAVRARAGALGIDLAAVTGSGPQGQVTHADLDREVLTRQGKPAAATGPRTAVHRMKVIGLRRKIAEKMQEAKRRIPHFGYVEEIDVTELEALRGQLNAEHGAARGKLTLLPFLVRALVRTLPSFPQLNARFDDEAGVVERFEAVHAGIATQTEHGLVVPVLRHAEARDLWDCAREIARLAAAARSGSAQKEELSGSTITITSLGPLGGVSHFPVINHPEVAILGPNKIVERAVVRDGQVVVRRMMNLSSAFDHRVVDGYDAAAFIQRLKLLLESPALLFVD